MLLWMVLGGDGTRSCGESGWCPHHREQEGSGLLRGAYSRQGGAGAIRTGLHGQTESRLLVLLSGRFSVAVVGEARPAGRLPDTF